MPELKTLYQQLLEPSPELISDLAGMDGDIIILGVGGKMGPALAKLAKKALDKAGVKKKLTGVSRFSERGLQEELNQLGIETISADLLNDRALQSLPDARNVLYLAGTKFGTRGREAFTWAMNSYLPGRVAEKYRNSNIVAFSTGNVYPLTKAGEGGATEQTQPQPIGEYAQSCLGRERVFEYFCEKNNTPVFIYRLNYANDVTYGVLLDIAKAVLDQQPIDLRMGHVNVIWQGDANEMALRALLHCKTPARIVNVTGPETTSVRWLAEEFGKLLNKLPRFNHEEQETALLSNAAEAVRLFGRPRVSLPQMIELLAEWVRQGGATLNKPTHFQERQGQF